MKSYLSRGVLLLFGLVQVTNLSAEDAPQGYSEIISHDSLTDLVAVITGDYESGLNDYRKDFHKLPKADNREVTRQLFGLNRKHKQYVIPELGTMVDDYGNVSDPWLEPYHFHLSKRLP